MKILLLIFPLLEISFLSECPCEMNASRQTQHESAPEGLSPVMPCRIAARSFAARHCSAALPNAPLRFLRHRRRSAPHTRDPRQRADRIRASKAYVKRKNDETFVSSFFLLVHFQSSALRKTYLRQFLKAFLKTKKCADFS